jgi:hypothetical protein
MVLAPYLLLTAAHLVQPAAAPRFDVGPSCRGASDQHLAYGQSFIECIRDETAARDEVSRNWSSYTGSARGRCSAEVMIGGDPSYVELLTCMELDKMTSKGMRN